MNAGKQSLSEGERKETFEEIFENAQLTKLVVGTRVEVDENNEKSAELLKFLQEIQGVLEEWHELLVEEGIVEENVSLLTFFNIVLAKYEDNESVDDWVEELTNETMDNNYSLFLEEIVPLLEAWKIQTDDIDINEVIKDVDETVFNEVERQIFQMLKEWKPLADEKLTTEKTIVDFMESVQKSIPKLDTKEIMQEATKILEILQRNLTKAEAHSETGSSAKTVTSLLAAIEQWAALTKEMDEQTMERSMHKVLSKEEQKMVANLMQRYNKKNALAGKKMYAQEAKVTKTDVKKWVSQALQKYEIADSSTTGERPNLRLPTAEVDSAISMNHFMPVSQKEQWLSLASYGNRVEEISNQLVQKLTTALQANSFWTNSNQQQQLTISLQPANLGDITIRMAQMNGEMTVQLIAASKATKELLESNIKQIRHLFAPHQISIERQEQISDEKYTFEEENEDQPSGEEQLNERENEEHPQDNAEDGVQTDFHTLLHNVGEREVVYDPVH